MLERHQTLHEQGARDDEHDRQRDLGDGEPFACPCAATAGDTAGAASQLVVHVAARGPEGRWQTKQHTDDQTESGGEEQHGTVDRHGLEPGQVRRREGHQCLRPPQRNHDPDGTRGHCLNECLHQQLPDDACATGAERRPYRHLRSAGGALRQQ